MKEIINFLELQENIKELVCTNENLKRINKIHRKENGKLRQENKRLKHIEDLYEGLLKDYDELLERIDTVMKIFEK